MPSEIEAMREFADNLWKQELKYRVSEMLNHAVNGYRAEVAANPGGGKLTVRFPFETNTRTFKCAASMSSAIEGDQVLVECLGSLSNAFIRYYADFRLGDTVADGSVTLPKFAPGILGDADGIATLGQNGKVPDAQLPPYQAPITASGILKGNGAGGVSAAVAGTDYSVGIPNRNLLDNPWFSNPVNQRGVASGATWGAGKYGLDRWYSDTNNAVKWNSAGYLVMPANTDNCVISQKIENRGIEAGTFLTASVLLEDGTVLKSKFAMPAVGSTEYGVFYGTEFSGSTFTNSVDGYYTFRLWYTKGNSTDGHVAAVKLELGSVSTLANDIAPNYAEELAKCQRYFQVFSGLAPAASFNTGLGIFFCVDLPVEMRTTPTVIMPAFTTEDPVVLSKTLNAPKTGYTLGVYTLGINSTFVQINLTNSDNTKYDIDDKFSAYEYPIAISADL